MITIEYSIGTYYTETTDPELDDWHADELAALAADYDY